jgi:hypothetical protein
LVPRKYLVKDDGAESCGTNPCDLEGAEFERWSPAAAVSATATLQEEPDPAAAHARAAVDPDVIGMMNNPKSTKRHGAVTGA